MVSIKAIFKSLKGQFAAYSAHHSEVPVIPTQSIPYSLATKKDCVGLDKNIKRISVFQYKRMNVLDVRSVDVSYNLIV